MIDLSKRDKTVLAFGAAFLVVFCIIEFICLPVIDKRKSLKRILADQDTAIMQMKRLQAEHAELNTRLDRQTHVLSKRAKNFTLFSFLDSQASKSNVKKNVAYMKPVTQEKEKQGYKVSKVKLKLKEVYLSNLVDFLYRVETSENAVYIMSLSLNKAGRKKDKLDAVIETQTLILKDAS